MKIAVVGTSNSILNTGYAPLYQAMEYPNQVDNFSIGATICQYIPFALEKYAILENYDVLITDSCPNDSDCFYCRQRTADWFYNELYTIFSAIKESKIKHLHLIFPYQHSNVLQKIHGQICEELSIPCLDIGTILSPFAEQAKQPLMQDIHHVSPYFARQLAYLIKQKRLQIQANPGTKPHMPYKTKQYLYYDLTKNFQGQFPLVTRASSHISEQFIHLKTNQELHIPHLPALNFEGLYFYTNKDAGFFSLTSQHACNNYSLYFPSADYIFYQPIPQNTFAVENFLTFQAGYKKSAAMFIRENNAAPPQKDQSELLLNALLFSKALNPPRTWEEKNSAQDFEADSQLFEKIHTVIMQIAQQKEREPILPPEIIFIAASLYPNNAYVRKEFNNHLKHTNNPYYFYYFTQFYLMPRKKYSLAIVLLERALQIKAIIPCMELLVTCYLKKNLFAKALKLLKKKMPANHITTYKLFCMLAAAMQNDKLFFQNAQKILLCSSHIDYLLFLASSCIQLQAFQEAVTLLNTALTDQRNFRPDNAEKNMQRIQKLMQNIEEQSE